MDRKTNRLMLLIVACSAAGVVVGGTSNWVDSHQCLKKQAPTMECLTQDPLVKTIDGMSIGLIAGAGAALGATMQLKEEE